jgi:hypothetical protein
MANLASPENTNQTVGSTAQTQPPGPTAATKSVPPTKKELDAGDMVAKVRAWSLQWPIVVIGVAVCEAVGLVLKSGSTRFLSMGLWSGFAIACVALLAAPMVRVATRLTLVQSWRIAAVGAGGLCFHWLAFVLPSLSSNPAFFMTVAVAGALWSVWLAPGRSEGMTK